VTEVWKDVPNYEGLYKVSNLGNVYSCRLKRNMARNPNQMGYVTVSMTKDKIMKVRPVHRLVAEAFIPNPENLPVVHHKDDNKQNNRVENLEWCTQKENVHYTIAAGNHGTMYGRKLNK
jgi:hypothetical protein